MERPTNFEVKHFTIPDNLINIGNGKTYYIRTYGCQANVRDSETIGGILQAMGFLPVNEPDSANIIVLNTCAIRDNAEQKVFGEIGFLKTIKYERPDTIFAVCGCMTQKPDVVEKIKNKHEHIDLIFGTHNIYELPQYLERVLFEKTKVFEIWKQDGEVVESLPSVRTSKIKAFVNIMFGCNNFCTYCIVPFTRGRQRSRSLAEIIKEINDLKQQGYKEITLVGQNVNSWGLDLVPADDFANLLKKVSETKISRIRFTTSNPWDFSDDIINAIAKHQENIMPYIHLPVQSGDNNTLRRMNRTHSIELYKEVISKIKKAIPNVALSTDIIVGFPNETEEEFQHTLDLFNEVQYDNAYTFIYSPRQKTPASLFRDSIPLEEKRSRLARLNELVNKYAQQQNSKYKGQVVNVLVEGFSKKKKTILSGYTEHQKLVNFEGSLDSIGTIVPVKITEAHKFTLNGIQVKKD